MSENSDTNCSGKTSMAADISLKVTNVVKLVESMVNTRNKNTCDKILSELNNINTIIGSLNFSDGVTIVPAEGNNSEILNKLEQISKKLDKPRNNNESTKNTRPKTKAIIVKPKSPETNPIELGAEIKQVIKNCESINCENIIVNAQATRIIVRDDNTIGKIKEALKNNEIGQKINVEQLKQLQPQISCVITTDQIEDINVIKRRNQIPEDQAFEIVVNKEIPTKSKFKRNYVVFRMSRVAREIIEKRGKIYIGCEATSFRDNFNVRVCSKCHRIGHTEKFCMNESVCGGCNVNHHTRNCQQTKKQISECLLCKHFGAVDVKHKPKSKDCYSYNAAIERIVQITDFDYQNEVSC
uniref:CCHC-type domain-containing protein n=1 Tax=Tetranychus urticae TaxID=32264 RepID=A0A158P4P8_TETUR